MTWSCSGLRFLASHTVVRASSLGEHVVLNHVMFILSIDMAGDDEGLGTECADTPDPTVTHGQNTGTVEQKVGG